MNNIINDHHAEFVLIRKRDNIPCKYCLVSESIRIQHCGHLLCCSWAQGYITINIGEKTKCMCSEGLIKCMCSALGTLLHLLRSVCYKDIS